MRRSGFFIRAREEEKRWIQRETEREGQRERPAALSGEEVRDFYRSLFEDEEGEMKREREDDRRERRREREEEQRERRREREEDRRERRRGKRHGKGGGACEGAVKNSGGAELERAPPAGRAEGYRLLRCAEQGDVAGVEELLGRGCDVNFRDEFNWSALMSAAFSGTTHTVRLLLQRGALWTHITDTQGRDACDLARLAGHHDVVRLLEQCIITHTSHTSHTPAEPTHSSPPPQWCEVCEVCYTDSAHTHTSSTLHQFSVKRRPALPHYCLTPSSVGYKLMLRLGWDPRSGLGPEHSGRLDPVGTVLKSDTTGFGFGPTPRSKVTHFKANDMQAVRRARKRREERQERGTTVTAKERRRTEERQTQWERDYRSSFYIDS